MKLLVTGATGFTGSHLVPALLESGHEVRCLVRPSSNRSRLPAGAMEIITGDLADTETLARALRGVQALVNLASLGFGHAPGIVAAAVKAGVRRAVFLSTTAIFTQLDAKSRAVRVSAEETIRQSGIGFTILRPTMIYGSARDRNMCRLIRYLKRWPLIPVVGSGKGLQQPVHVADVADAIRCSLANPATEGKCYNISGGSILTFDELIDTICRLLRRRVFKIHLPRPPIVFALQVAEKLALDLPIKAEQLLRLDEDKAFDYAEARNDFGYAPRPFSEGIEMEIEEMGMSPQRGRTIG